MNSQEIRQNFLSFFESKKHKIVASDLMVRKNDPTLMFTNAGMNQFKDIFLGNSPIVHKRIANSQKCLRVKGKHNDLEEVGHDTYHHTMFEMLGNWSFGDYFKEDAINWGWELLTEVFNIPKDRLYATVFEGDSASGIAPDDEAKALWLKHLDASRIIYGNKKDNFWEMGETGPCGPCSEIHVDLRDEADRKKIDAVELINKDHHLVIEIWNLVFIQYNRKSDGNLEQLPANHVDTGMGFERLCMVVQGKKSNYDTDVFQPIIQEICKISNVTYGVAQKIDVALRVVADHLRTVSFAIADGELPSNTDAGYVIRRILRRAIRYAYTYLDRKEPFMYKLLPVLNQVMGEAYPELVKSATLIQNVLLKEEESFHRTLETGIKLLDKVIAETKEKQYSIIDGKTAFKLHDTYGFPLDLTQLIAKENNLIVNNQEFDEELKKQVQRSQNDATVNTDDWVVLRTDDKEEFVGYDFTDIEVFITRYRKVTQKGKEIFHVVFNITPFYAESGGQLGDSGYIQSDTEKIEIVDTKKENDLSVHICNELPQNITAKFQAVVNKENRIKTECNHSATHLLHHALREVLGSHVEQKGSLVEAARLRFDFSHYQKVSDEELKQVETIVNQKIRMNYSLNEKRAIPIKNAQEMGAMALFGEKYGDLVRVIQFGDSVELCGGTHIDSTGKIGLLKIVSEGAIAAGIRRIEAITADEAEKFINSELTVLNEIKQIFKTSQNVETKVKNLVEENILLKKQIEAFQKERLKTVKNELKNRLQAVNGINVITSKIEIYDASDLKDLAFQLKGEVENLYLVLGAELGGKANIAVMISDELVKAKNLNAGNIIRNISKEIQGGGGGQAFFATAGGKNPEGIENALNMALKYIE